MDMSLPTQLGQDPYVTQGQCFSLTAVFTNHSWCGMGCAGLSKAAGQKSHVFTVYSARSHNLQFDGICYSLEESQHFWVKSIRPTTWIFTVAESQLRIEQDLTVMTRSEFLSFSSWSSFLLDFFSFLAQQGDIFLLSLWASEMWTSLYTFKISDLG